VSSSAREEGDHDRAFWARVARYVLTQPRPERRIESLLSYLEAFPTGRCNRRAAERIESELRRVADPRVRDALRARLRSARAPFMPPVEPDTWPGD